MCVCAPIYVAGSCRLLQIVAVCCSEMNPRLRPVEYARVLIYVCNRCTPCMRQESLGATRVFLCTKSPVARGAHHECVKNLFTAIGVC